MDRNTIAIGIDHGWANMKTVHTVFTSGVKEITTEPALFSNVLEYRGKYYKIGGSRLEVKKNKVSDDNYYLLTLAALAKELKGRGQKNAHVLLAVGLPLTRFGDEKKDFISYLSRDREVVFRFEKVQYRIVIERVSVYPQCYGAVADMISSFPVKQLVVDIGSWTVDIMPIMEHEPDESACVTQPHGMITCIRQINKECVRQLNEEVDEAVIRQMMIKGSDDIPEPYTSIIENEFRKYAQKIYLGIRELGYNMSLTPVIFVGGGAVIMKRFGGVEQGNIRYIEDICANAKGYESLGSSYVAMAAKKRA
ncbi:MAG: ParM/StbA family protein [Lachnospiraceae bacterium]|nr:ParM/StbA family protein [Lachnospiraceae bacterium]